MTNDILKSIPQGGNNTETTENNRIHEIVDELRRGCELYEAQFRNGQNYVRHFDTEQRVAEKYAKENGIWLPMSNVFELGVPGPSGNENDTYVSNDIIYKVNNLLNSGSIIKLLEKIIMHNELFYDTAYSFYAFAGFDGGTVMPVLKQYLIKNAQPATQIMIDTYMAAIGFSQTDSVGRYFNSMYEVWDLLPRNVLIDREGDIYIIDAEIKMI